MKLKLSKIFTAIRAERHRQEQLHAPCTCASPLIEPAHKLAVLTEEVGEVAKEVLDLTNFERETEDPEAKLRTELIQVSAVCVAWLESLEPQEEA
jgi:hypothetical protein